MPIQCNSKELAFFQKEELIPKEIFTWPFGFYTSLNANLIIFSGIIANKFSGSQNDQRTKKSQW